MTTSPGIAAVTGASRGIGRATAIALARDGYRVFGLARSAQDLQALASDIPTIEALMLDIADEESRAAAVDAIMAATDGYGVDVLINNAGYAELGPIEELTAQRLRRQLEVNVIGLHDFTIPFLSGMRGRKRGIICNVSSVAGRISTPFMGPYSASKFALEALSDAARVELAPFGVRVVLIEPGPIATNFGEASVRPENPDSPYAPFTRRLAASKRASDMWQRSPDVVARVILRAIHARHPRARYTVTLSARAGALGRRIMPDRFMDVIFRRAIGAD